MGQKIFAQSIEDANVTLTNGGASSDAKLLQRRDLRVKGLDVAAGTTTVTVEIDYGVSTTIDYVILGNLYTDAADVETNVEYWNGSAWVEWVDAGDLAADNTNHYITGASQAATKFRVNFVRGTSKTLELSCIFLGVEYETPVGYYAERAPFSTVFANEIEYDGHGYPYGHQANPNQKQRYDLSWGLTLAQAQTMATNLGYAGNNLKPFFFYEGDRDTDYHLVVKIDGSEFKAPAQNALYYSANLRLQEL